MALQEVHISRGRCPKADGTAKNHTLRTGSAVRVEGEEARQIIWAKCECGWCDIRRVQTESVEYLND
ncbi:hypothetical protein [Haladaptatus cibarius]|uniref:hypothetical protein n=1 Tax=Haladaptatus cibarius TaxID=453847 RepID=UPI000678CEDB|nr:hypothetical protein [Haladaptatus cibarius]